MERPENGHRMQDRLRGWLAHSDAPHTAPIVQDSTCAAADVELQSSVGYYTTVELNGLRHEIGDDVAPEDIPAERLPPVETE